MKEWKKIKKQMKRKEGGRKNEKRKNYTFYMCIKYYLTGVHVQ
jgi:hypothetical protein